MNLTCNSTLEDMRITSEITIVGPLTFHELALIIAGASALVAIVLSFWLIYKHATNYTKPREQKHIIRILFMVPIYSTASFLSLRFYWHAIYYQVISDCYEAFAISSFFALLCHYVAPDLHEQKDFFRHLHPIKPWVWPLNWFKKCCGGERGPWRTPQSGLTWFNINWIGIYHYCFIRVAMTITAVVTQYFDRYCESSNSPVFSHIWTIALNSLAVTVAMYCVIQFYVQLRDALADHQPFLKVLAIKLVIFLSFWQSAAISVGTSTLNIVRPNAVLAYPDLKVGIPSLLLCFEMACFALLHQWAFPYRPYLEGAPQTFYPVPDPTSGSAAKPNEHYKKSGGFMGLLAIFDALNIWDVIKAFGRGIRWLFVGVKHRHEDISYQATASGKMGEVDMDDLSPRKGRHLNTDTAYRNGHAKSTDHLPIATEFRRSKFDLMYGQQPAGGPGGPGGATASVTAAPDPESLRRANSDEAAGLIEHAQPMSHLQRADSDLQQRYRDDTLHQYHQPPPLAPYRDPEDMEGFHRQQQPPPSVNNRTSTQIRVGEALWGPPRGEPGPGR